jgi:hypothetical protein
MARSSNRLVLMPSSGRTKLEHLAEQALDATAAPASDGLLSPAQSFFQRYHRLTTLAEATPAIPSGAKVATLTMRLAMTLTIATMRRGAHSA